MSSIGREYLQAPGAKPAFRLIVHGMAIMAALCCFVMIVAGGMVTSLDAGDSVPDWPLSYGSLLPPMVGNVFYEHGHRMIGWVLGALTIALTVTLARREPRRWVRRLGYLALPAVVGQGLLGGFRVHIVSNERLQALLFGEPTGGQVEQLRVAVSILHTATAQSILCLFAVLALVTSKRWLRNEDGQQHVNKSPVAADLVQPPMRRLHRLATTSVCLVFLQLLLGALRRQTDGTIILHACGAAAVTIALAALVRHLLVRFGDRPGLTRAAAGLLVLVVLQVSLGITSWLVIESARTEMLPQPQLAGSTLIAGSIMTAHLVIGASMLALCVMLTVTSYVDLRQRGVMADARQARSESPAATMVTA